jgi:site-specific DNA-cytosine methylase
MSQENMYLHDDIRSLSAERLRVAGALPDIIVGSPPCPAYSAANSRGRGIEDDPLFLEYVRLVGECRPVWCVAENSPNLRVRGFDRIATELEHIGYACWPLVVRASDFGDESLEGSPLHERARAWIVAANAGRARLAVGEEQPPRREQPATERGVRAEQQPAGFWTAGFSPPPLLDDGPPLDLALYRAVCAAQGDAIVPQVALPILRAMRNAFPDARRVLDLFGGGVGGWHYACAWAGLEVVAACEIDPWRREVYRAVHVGVGRRSERSAAR